MQRKQMAKKTLLENIYKQVEASEIGTKKRVRLKNWAKIVFQNNLSMNLLLKSDWKLLIG